MTDAFHHSVLEDVLDVALAHVDTRRWGMAVRVFSWIRSSAKHSRDGWAAARLDELAELIDTDRRWIDKLLRRMTLDERCLIREVPFGTRLGQAPARYAPNPRLTQWSVPWVVSRETVLGRLGYWRGLNGWVVARSYSAPQPTFVARSTGGSTRHSFEPVARYTGGSTRHSDEAVARYGNAPQLAGLPSSVVGAVGNGERPSALESEQEQEAVDRACAALLPRCPRGIYGGLLRDVRAAVVELGVDAVVAGIAEAPSEYQGPLTIQWVRGLLDDGLPPLPELDPLGPASFLDRAVGDRRRQLESSLAAYAAAGEEPPPSLVEELAACENGHASTPNGATA